ENSSGRPRRFRVCAALSLGGAVGGGTDRCRERKVCSPSWASWWGSSDYWPSSRRACPQEADTFAHASRQTRTLSRHRRHRSSTHRPRPGTGEGRGTPTRPTLLSDRSCRVFVRIADPPDARWCPEHLGGG